MKPAFTELGLYLNSNLWGPLVELVDNGFWSASIDAPWRPCVPFMAQGAGVVRLKALSHAFRPTVP